MTDETTDRLGQIRHLIKVAKDRQDEIAAIEKDLAERKKALQDITDRLLPELFSDAGIESIEMDGQKIEVKEFYVGSSKDPRAVQWLIDNGFEDIIKNTVTAEFKKGEGELAKEVAQYLEQRGYTFRQKEDIHHATLRSFINERMEEDPDHFPRDLFNVQQIRQVKPK